MLRLCKTGYDTSIPSVGDRFFLQIGLYVGKALFPPACITHNGERFHVHYSVRSVSSLLDFRLGQVWEVEVVRLRRSVRNGRIFTIARLDLHACYDVFMGYFDYHTKMWRLCQETMHGLMKVADKHALVRYSEYVRTVSAGNSVRYEVGYFPEVLDTTGEILMRYSPPSVREINECERNNYIAFPHDNVPLATDTNVGKLQKLIQV